MDLISESIQGLFSIHLTENPSIFSAANVFQTMGFITGFTISLVACTKTKLYFYIGLSVLSLLSYLILLGLQNFKKDHVVISTEM
jgi:hypothetical protein